MTQPTSTTLLDELHQWKLKNPGHPRRMTISEHMHKRMKAEISANPSYRVSSNPETGNAPPTFYNIPYAVDSKQTQPVIYHQ